MQFHPWSAMMEVVLTVIKPSSHWDGKAIEFPYTVYGSQLDNGAHTLTASYTDYAGNNQQRVQYLLLIFRNLS
jgi:hypothetical protein